MPCIFMNFSEIGIRWYWLRYFVTHQMDLLHDVSGYWNRFSENWPFLKQTHSFYLHRTRIVISTSISAFQTPEKCRQLCIQILQLHINVFFYSSNKQSEVFIFKRAQTSICLMPNLIPKKRWLETQLIVVDRKNETNQNKVQSLLRQKLLLNVLCKNVNFVN